MALAIPVAFLQSRKFPKRIGLGKEHPTGKEIKEISWRQPKTGQPKGHFPCWHAASNVKLPTVKRQ